jgi:hypothetical protein
LGILLGGESMVSQMTTLALGSERRYEIARDLEAMFIGPAVEDLAEEVDFGVLHWLL